MVIEGKLLQVHSAVLHV